MVYAQTMYREGRLGQGKYQGLSGTQCAGCGSKPYRGLAGVGDSALFYGNCSPLVVAAVAIAAIYFFMKK